MCLGKQMTPACTQSDAITALQSGCSNCPQLWKFQPWVQKAVNASLRELKGLNNPTVAFHVRGGDLSADLQANVRTLLIRCPSYRYVPYVFLPELA